MSRLSNPYTIFTWIGKGKVGPLAVSMILFVISLVAVEWFYRKTLWGRQIALMGGNKIAATLCGYNMKRPMVLVYTICGLFAGMGSIVLISRVTTASPVAGAG